MTFFQALNQVNHILGVLSLFASVLICSVRFMWMNRRRTLGCVTGYFIAALKAFLASGSCSSDSKHLNTYLDELTQTLVQTFMILWRFKEFGELNNRTIENNGLAKTLTSDNNQRRETKNSIKTIILKPKKSQSVVKIIKLLFWGKKKKPNLRRSCSIYFSNSNITSVHIC